MSKPCPFCRNYNTRPYLLSLNTNSECDKFKQIVLWRCPEHPVSKLHKFISITEEEALIYEILDA
jgi:hypothetical protein